MITMFRKNDHYKDGKIKGHKLYLLNNIECSKQQTQNDIKTSMQLLQTDINNPELFKKLIDEVIKSIILNVGANLIENDKNNILYKKILGENYNIASLNDDYGICIKFVINAKNQQIQEFTNSEYYRILSLKIGFIFICGLMLTALTSAILSPLFGFGVIAFDVFISVLGSAIGTTLLSCIAAFIVDSFRGPHQRESFRIDELLSPLGIDIKQNNNCSIKKSSIIDGILDATARNKIYISLPYNDIQDEYSISACLK